MASVRIRSMSARMTTDIRFRVFANLYKDSVALMQVGAALRKRPGVVEASCIMATPANLEQLQHADLSVDADVHPSDLLVVVRGEAQACDDALDAAQALLQSAPADVEERGAFSMPLTSIAAGVEQSPMPISRSFRSPAITRPPRR